MIRSIAVDDEPLALEVIKKYVSETPLVILEETFTDAIQAITYLKSHPVNLLFLDVQMPDINGIQLLNSLKVKPLVVFTTAYQEYAVQGFDLEAVDYLVKPIKYDRFMKAVLKVQKILHPAETKEKSEEGFIFIKSEYQSVKLYFRDIRYIEGLDDYIKIHLVSDPKPVLSLMSLKSIVQKLPADQFMRVHRSFIIPLRKIVSIRNRNIYLDNMTIPIGDTYYPAVQEWLSGC
jgi:two-component system, LytTR family, response regulator